MTSAQGTLSVLRASPSARVAPCWSGPSGETFHSRRSGCSSPAAANQAGAAFEEARVPLGASHGSGARSRPEEHHLKQVIDKIPALAWSTPDSVPVFFNQYYLDYVGVPGSR